MNGSPLRHVLSSLCLAVLVLLCGLRSASAQDEVPTVTRTVALENATVVQAPGRVLEGATVVVRNGLIQAVGLDAAIPFDARRIAADSLTVYAGFISGLSYAAVDEPGRSGEERDVENPGNPPAHRAGIQPQRRARTLLDPSERRVDSLRSIGFTAAHVVPEGRMLPGTGAIVQLAGDDPNAMVLRTEASLFAQFRGARGVYPATAMATIATWRQLYREANRRKQLEARYMETPNGRERPPSDPVHSAFFPTLDGTTPVFFYTKGVLETHRALALHEELGFPMTLVGLREGFRAADALQATDADLFLSLKLPEEKKEKSPTPDTLGTGEADTTEATAPRDPSEVYERGFRTRSHADTADELENLKARQAMEREAYYQNAATLHAAGVRFGFASLDVSPGDVRNNLRTMIDHGLPENAALAALTTQPAAMLGLEQQLGTVEAGKIANLVVTNGPYFTEGSEVRYVFIDGRMFEIDAASEAEDDATDETPTY